MQSGEATGFPFISTGHLSTPEAISALVDDAHAPSRQYPASQHCRNRHQCPGQPLAAGDLVSAAARLRVQFLKDLDPAYVENVIIPHFLVSSTLAIRNRCPSD